jgi:hypothetical protein
MAAVRRLHRRDGWRSELRLSQRPFAKQLGGSTPAASTPHRGARFAFDAMMSIGQSKLPGSIRPPRPDQETEGLSRPQP